MDTHRPTIHNTNVNLLVALHALLEQRSVTAAARTVGITQSGMSNTLATLRELLGDPLLVRVGRSMQPTPQGLAVQGDLEAGVRALQRVLDGSGAFDPTTSERRFQLALSDRAEAILFAELMAAVRAEAPGIKLQVLPWGRLAAPPALADGEVDLSVGIVPRGAPSLGGAWPSGPPKMAPGLHTERLLDATLVTLARADHPRIGARLSLPRFCELEHVLVTEQPDGLGIVDDALARMGRQRRVVARVPRHTLVGELIARTDLITSIDRRIAQREAARHSLRTFKLPVTLPEADLGMIWHHRTHSDPAARWLRRHVRAAVDRVAA